MSRGFQMMVVTGHLGADPEVRYNTGGSAVASLRVATTETWRSKSSGETETHTEWHRIKVFGKTAEFADKYLRKGRLVTVTGKIRTERWTPADGGERFSTWLYADSLDAHGSAERNDIEPRSDRRQPRGQAAPASEPASSGAGEDDDIPF